MNPGSFGEPMAAPLAPALCFGPRYMVMCAQQGIVGMLGDWWMFVLIVLLIFTTAFLLGWFARAYLDRVRDSQQQQVRVNNPFDPKYWPRGTR